MCLQHAYRSSCAALCWGPDLGSRGVAKLHSVLEAVEFRASGSSVPTSGLLLRNLT